MIEIIQYKPVNKGNLQGFLSIKIQKWGNFIIRDMAFFKKNDQKWVSFPQKSYEKDGATKYVSLNLFEDPTTSKSFQEKVLEALEEVIKLSPNGINLTKREE
jgi:hypothetical protein